MKQVIVIRKDLKMRRGKEIAQGSHASIAFLLSKLRSQSGKNRSLKLTEEEIEWIGNGQAKIVVCVNSEKELMKIHKSAKDSKLNVHIITDSGKPEFGGVPTKTCIAIGPHKESEFVGVTDELPLY
jgi:PTH2 family peptidyl-tRNA hydrolase